LVSHKERDLKEFCTRGLYLRGGSLAINGTLTEALNAYQKDSGGIHD
jgi:ABC-2 type transport system ATP-binding protein